MKMILRFLPLLILGGAIITAYSFGLHEYLTLDSIKAQKEEFKDLIDNNPVWAPLAFVGIYAASVALSLPIATFLTLLGGFLFGAVKGTLMVVSAATIGAAIIFTLSLIHI